MRLNFWNKKEPEVKELPVTEKVEVPMEEPVKERGYFDTVVAADIAVRTRGEQIPVVQSPEAAMKLATVYRCTSILSGSIASLPLQLKCKRQGVFMVDENNDINYLLNVKPNSRQTAYEMKRNAIIQTLNAGNAYIYPDWGGGELRSLTLLSPHSVTYDKILNIYMVNDPINCIFKTLDSDEIIHLRNMSVDGGYEGDSVIRYACATMGIMQSADRKTALDFQPGNTHRGFISGDSGETTKGYQYNEPQLEDASKRFREELQSGETITYLPGNLKFNQLSLSPADIQLALNKGISALDLCRFYGVHPDKNFIQQSQNYKASEMSQVQFMTDTLQPLLRQIENEFFVKLIPRSISSKYKIQFNIESFYQTDLEAISNYEEKQISSGQKLVNELRAEKGKLPVKGGDEPMISCNVAPLNSRKIWGQNVKNENNGN